MSLHSKSGPSLLSCRLAASARAAVARKSRLVKVLSPTAQGVLDHLEHEPKKAEPAAWRYRQQRNGLSKLMFDTFSDELICSFKSWA